MNLKKAKQLFEEIVDICYQTENPKLIEAVEPIYRDVEASQDVSQIIVYAEELQVVMNEMDIDEEKEDDIQDIQEKIEMLSE